mgnify:CR=1 FL=1
MTEIHLSPKEFELLQKWYGLLFGGTVSRHVAEDEDRKLLAKITLLHLVELENEKRLRGLLKGSDEE